MNLIANFIWVFFKRTPKWIPRCFQPKFFVVQYYGLDPGIYIMSIYDDVRKNIPLVCNVFITDVTYAEAQAFIALLPNGGKLGHETDNPSNHDFFFSYTTNRLHHMANAKKRVRPWV